MHVQNFARTHAAMLESTLILFCNFAHSMFTNIVLRRMHTAVAHSRFGNYGPNTIVDGKYNSDFFAVHENTKLGLHTDLFD